MTYGTELTGAIIKMGLALALVLAILWSAQRWARRNLSGGQTTSKGRLIKVLASQYLGAKKSIALVQVPGTLLVLGVGSEQINLLTSINDPEVIDKLLQEADKGRLLGFKDHLQRLTRSVHHADQINGIQGS